jgi:outer membrane protein OmpA-like peptidoglycan-associated protein
MASITTLKLSLATLLTVGLADLAWIGLSLGPRALSTGSMVASHSPARVPASTTNEPTEVAARASAPSLAKPIQEPQAAVAPSNQVADQSPTEALEIQPVYFDSMSKRVDTTARATLAEIVKRAGPGSIIQLEGHADYRGDERFNEELSRDRADAAAAFLIKKGISATRIKREHLGERGAAEAPADELWRDRRVDIRIIEGDT